MVTIAETTEPVRGAKGRRITTHWGYIEALRERAEDTTVLERVRYVRDGSW